MYRSKVKATPEQIARLKLAREMPLVALHAGPSSKSPLEMAHEFALEAGLPEQPGHYGIDLRTREFLSEYPIEEAPPDA